MAMCGDDLHRSFGSSSWNQRIDDTEDKDFNTLTVGFKAKFGY